MVPDLCPWLGLVEFDPTNGIVGNRDLIRVGGPRTPSRQSRCPGVTGAMLTMNSEWKSRRM